jgi:hypothetical protein
MIQGNKCLAGCGRTITRQFAICAECEKIYGSRMADWPEWLKFLWKDTLKERRREHREWIYEVPFEDERPPVHDGKVPPHKPAD